MSCLQFLLGLTFQKGLCKSLIQMAKLKGTHCFYTNSADVSANKKSHPTLLRDQYHGYQQQNKEQSANPTPGTLCRQKSHLLGR